MNHPQGHCPEPTAILRIVGDLSRAAYHICAACRTTYEAAPFSFTFVDAKAPEWTVRAAERRLPAKVA